MCAKEEIRSKSCIIRKGQYRPDEHPPWAGMAFAWPLGSDDLFLYLKAAYPDGDDFLQRKHLAAIDFLKRELEDMQSRRVRSSASHDPVDSISIYSAHSEMNVPRDTFTESSRPHSVAPRTPQSATSSLASQTSQALAERSRCTADSAQMRGATLSTAPTTASQTYVFSAVDGTPLQPRTKKKMSTQERKDYKETRKRGACDKCRKTKAKCTHGSESMALPQGYDNFPRATKRGGSTALDDDQIESTKLLKTEEGSSVRQRKPEKIRRPRSLVISPQTVTDQLRPCRSAGSFPLAGTMPNSEQWKIGSGQNEGYVQAHGIRDLPQGQFSGGQVQGYPSLQPQGPMEHFDPGFSGDGPQMQSDPYSPSPLVNDPHDPTPFHFGYSTLFDFPGMNPQDQQLGDAGQT